MSTPTWCSRTNYGPLRNAVMQANGELVLYDIDGRQAYTTGTSGHPGSYLAVQDDGEVQIWDVPSRKLRRSKREPKIVLEPTS